MSEPSPVPSPSTPRPSRLRKAGVIILVVGLAGAGVLYWARTRAPDVEDDPMMIGFDKPARMQMGVMYGKMGLMTEDLTNSLEQPGTQAFLLAAGSVLVSWACFFAASRGEE